MLDTFRIVFRILFAFFKPFSYRFKTFSGAVSFCRCAALIEAVSLLAIRKAFTTGALVLPEVVEGVCKYFTEPNHVLN